MTRGPGSIPATALAACALGLLLSPYPYLAVPVRSESVELSLWLSLLLLPCSGFVLWRALSKPHGSREPRIAFLVLEVLCWALTAAVLYLVSGARLMRGPERLGAACVVFLAMSALCVPLVISRNSTLVQRLLRVPRGLALFALLSILVLCGSIAGYHLVVPSQPIAG